MARFALQQLVAFVHCSSDCHAHGKGDERSSEQRFYRAAGLVTRSCVW